MAGGSSRLINARVVVDDSHHVDGWQLEVCADAKLLAESGPHSALALARVNGHQELTHLGHEELTHPGAPGRVALTQ